VSARIYLRALIQFQSRRAAVEGADGRTFSGCNIENSGYSLTLWAPLSRAVFESWLDFVRSAASLVANCSLPHLTIHSFESI
jgi:cytidine deaminase